MSDHARLEDPMVGGSLPQMDFGHLRIAYDARVLTPRPWTEAQSTWAAEIMTDAPEGPVLEVCCGAGQIGLLAVSRVSRRLVAVDLSGAACDLTRYNAEVAGLARRVDVRQGPMDSVLASDERFALVVADPPWVRRAETGRFPEDPLLAIDGGHDGMQVAWSCLTVAEQHLMPGGSQVLQLGDRTQVERVREHLDYTDLELVEVRDFDRGVLVRIDRPLSAA